MINKIAFLALVSLVVSTTGWTATSSCSRINLTKCLDSACAINISSNPAARCQYCGTDAAGAPASSMRSVSAGASSKNTISAKELKNAPSDPGERYVWATKLCLNILQNCTSDDVSEAYDPLIEKSCTAAGISQDMATLQKKSATNKKTESSCTNEITLCLTADSKCSSDFSKCSQDDTFNNFFATCSSDAIGCTSFINSIRETVSATRKNILAGTKTNIIAIVESHIRNRMQQLSSINSDCTDDKKYKQCVENVCQNNTSDNCESDTRIANALCEFYKTACSRIKLKSEQELQKELDDLTEQARQEANK